MKPRSAVIANSIYMWLAKPQLPWRWLQLKMRSRPAAMWMASASPRVRWEAKWVRSAETHKRTALECVVCVMDSGLRSRTSGSVRQYYAKSEAGPLSASRSCGTTEWTVCLAIMTWVPFAGPKCRRELLTPFRSTCLRRSLPTAKTIGTSCRCSSRWAKRHWSSRAQPSESRIRSRANVERPTNTKTYLLMQRWSSATAQRSCENKIN